uniref:Uncharacterized protein n=1 Tax=Panagrellus redivivus TaxID=6233 RepID=A0A7E4USN0_PANRE
MTGLGSLPAVNSSHHPLRQFLLTGPEEESASGDRASSRTFTPLLLSLPLEESQVVLIAGNSNSSDAMKHHRLFPGRFGTSFDENSNTPIMLECIEAGIGGRGGPVSSHDKQSIGDYLA